MDLLEMEVEFDLPKLACMRRFPNQAVLCEQAAETEISTGQLACEFFSKGFGFFWLL
jgi:hypothetical protein